MSETPPPNAAAHAFDCPLCDGAFEVDAEWLGQTIACPHCNGDVLLPELASAPAPVEPDPVESTPVESTPSAETPTTASSAATPASTQTQAPEPAPRRLTLEERAALRKKINLGFALFGAVLLIVLFVILSQFG